MKRRRCTTCKHAMKGHKKQRCLSIDELILPCGSSYSGTLYENKPSGRGRLNSSDLSYEGGFLNGERHGEGVEVKKDVYSYKGQWLQNMYHGYGKLELDTTVYEGMFSRNRYHGKGILLKNKML